MRELPRGRKGLKARGGFSKQLRARAIASIIALIGIGGIVLLVTAGPNSIIPSASATGDLYFTTTQPPTVDQVNFSYQSGHLVLGSHSSVVQLRGADGLLFAPDGRLLVGGVRTGDVFAVDPHTGAVSAIPAGVPESAHLALSPDGGTLFTSGEPGQLARIPLNPEGPGQAIALHGSTTAVTGLAFGPGNQVMYTDSPPDGFGSIGLLNLSTGETRRLFGNMFGAHGIVYDSFSKSYIVVGYDVVLQIAAADPTQIESEAVLHGNHFDQEAVTGRGQVIIASHNGSLVLIDYASSGHVGNVSNPVFSRHLANNLDDIAPLVGPGARPIATSARTRRLAGGSALAASLVLLVALSVRYEWQRRRTRPPRPERDRQQLPRWDRRRHRSSSGSGRW